MHMDGYAQCQPKKVIMRHAGGQPILAEDADFARSFATYTTGDHTIPYTRMPFFENPQLGFLGTAQGIMDADDGSEGMVLQSCASIPHCALQPFTIRGFTIPNRLVYRSNSLAGPQDYKIKDSIGCGAFGYVTNPTAVSNTICKVDLDVVPFFRVVCQGDIGLLAAKCLWWRELHDTYTSGGIQLSRQSVCSSITDSYMPKDKDAKRHLVNELPYQLTYWSEDSTLERSVEGSFADIEAQCAAWDGSSGDSLNAYTWLTKNVGHVSGDNLQSYQDTINDAIRNAGGREILRIFEAVKLQGLLGGSTVTNFFNPTCFNKININIERLENEKTLNDASLTRMLTRVKKLVELGEFGNIALTTEDLEWHQVTCTDESRCLTHLDERISNASTSLIQRINDLITRAGSVERQNYLDSVEFDRDIDGIHLFRLPELEDTSGYLLTEIAKVFKTGDNCQLNTGVADSTSMCLYTDALVDPKLKQAYASQYVHEKTMVKLETGTGASLSSVLYEGDPWSASEDGSIIQFDPCAGYIQGNNPGYVVEKSRKKHWGTCAITQEITCTDFWTGNLLSGACWGSAETRANWASTEERSYPVNHECFLLTNEPPPREDSGVTMSTGAQDDRVARFTYVHISEGVTFSVSHAPSEVLLEANTDLSYVGLSAVPVTILRENAFALVNAVLPFVKIPDTDSEVKQGRRFKNSWSLKGVIFQSILTLRSLGLTSDPFLSMVILMTATLPPNILPVLPDAWLALLGKSSRLVGTIYAHVPRYLSDYYESVPRITDDVEILHLYDCDSIKGVASVRGMDVPTTGSVFRSKSSFEPLPEIRFKITSRDRNLAVEQKSKQPVSRLAFAQFHHHQIPEAFFDPAYPSALHTKSNSVYASLGNLRHLIQSKLTSSAADALECHGCVQVKRKEYARYASKEPPKNSNPFGSVPGGYHTSDWHGLNRVRTLQDIIDQVDINNKDQPWVLMGKTYSQFYEEVKTALPVFWISLYDIISPDTYDFAKLKTVIREGNDIPFLYNLNEKTNTVEVDLGYFMGSWVLQHFAEAKLVYIANNWPTLSSKWFEVYNRPRPITRGPWLGGPGGSTQAIENAGVVGYTIGLEQGLYCHDEKAKDVNCGPLKLGVKKTLNTKKCFECTYISEKLCTGQNKCGARPWLRSYMGDDFKNWIKVGPKTETLQTIIDGTWMSPAKHVEITWAVLRTGIINDPVLNIVESIRDSRNNNLWTKPRISVPFVIGDKNAPLFDGLFEKFPLTWDSWGAYNPEGAIKYEETTGIIDPVTKIPAPGACIDDDTPETNFVDYTECDMNSGIEFLARHTVENFSHKRGVCIPTGSRASWEITRDQMTGTGAVPFWANANRESRDRFVSWIVDHKEHCRNHHGDRTQSVCYPMGIVRKVCASKINPLKYIFSTRGWVETSHPSTSVTIRTNQTNFPMSSTRCVQMESVIPLMLRETKAYLRKNSTHPQVEERVVGDATDKFLPISLWVLHSGITCALRHCAPIQHVHIHRGRLRGLESPLKACIPRLKLQSVSVCGPPQAMVQRLMHWVGSWYNHATRRLLVRVILPQVVIKMEEHFVCHHTTLLDTTSAIW
ncbi:hypothetical protein T484DRAFT_1756784 [Baffinella frigidus]|nr:hypothetical protein T484DRAFT_1756784 [Cryptophyta sp. CCMP2293]